MGTVALDTRCLHGEMDGLLRLYALFLIRMTHETKRVPVLYEAGRKIALVVIVTV